ncbi:hypothetical protein EX30DRAFT_48778 [Ascodesmis nigricans]|uniref:Uncharacterized protein n=1 Tax=Ascodesmis nigricans TaxID=341454 RepID=A0A4S2MVR2_9PEZI|nr:hypothetical protein EX30DRAFT_48778 [Ascodesmis nigricans]
MESNMLNHDRLDSSLTLSRSPWTDLPCIVCSRVSISEPSHPPTSPQRLATSASQPTSPINASSVVKPLSLFALANPKHRTPTASHQPFLCAHPYRDIPSNRESGAPCLYPFIAIQYMMIRSKS